MHLRTLLHRMCRFIGWIISCDPSSTFYRTLTQHKQIHYNMNNSNKLIRDTCFNHKTTKHAGAELGQAQLKLGLDLNQILCIFGFSIFDFVELVEWTLYFRLYWKDLVLYIFVQCSLFFPFYTILFQLEIAEIDITSYSYPQLVVASG